MTKIYHPSFDHFNPYYKYVCFFQKKKSIEIVNSGWLDCQFQPLKGLQIWPRVQDTLFCESNSFQVEEEKNSVHWWHGYCIRCAVSDGILQFMVNYYYAHLCNLPTN